MFYVLFVLYLFFYKFFDGLVFNLGRWRNIFSCYLLYVKENRNKFWFDGLLSLNIDFVFG